MTPVMIRTTAIGAGIPKICVPIVGKTKEEIVSEASRIAQLPADLVEWRADWYEHVDDVDDVRQLLVELRQLLGEKVFLFTFRTAAEGGAREITAQDYEALCLTAAASQAVDLIDAELFMGDELFGRIQQAAHDANVYVIASNHDFAATPAKEELICRLRHMQELGADILKIAVMPKEPADVLTLLSATEEMHRLYAKQPLITMSMQGMGAISRMCGELFGSAVTFASAGKESAPGQPQLSDLETMLALFHGVIG